MYDRPPHIFQLLSTAKKHEVIVDDLYQIFIFLYCSFLLSWPKQNQCLGVLEVPMILPLNQICTLPSLDFSSLSSSLSFFTIFSVFVSV